jgi:hypothetical protein
MDELNNCCGTTCDKRIVIEHFNDALAINARLSAENEKLKRQINDMAQRPYSEDLDQQFWAETRRDVYTVLAFLVLINFILWVKTLWIS